MRSYLTSLALASFTFAIMPGCSGGDDLNTEGTGVESTQEALYKCSGGTNLQFDYCDDPACPCDDGEGDCENDTQCTASPGLVCGVDNGRRYGGYWQTNVCWPATCQNGVLDPGEVTIDNGGPCGCQLFDFYYDYDNDGWGGNQTPIQACTAPSAQWVQTTGDCDTTNPNINPGVAEICGDGIDNDCSGTVDDGCTTTTWCVDNDGDSYPRSTNCITQVQKPAHNWVATNGSTQYDCVDTNAAIFPGATEVCNGKDDDCNGQVDDGVASTTWYLDNDLDGYPRSTISQQACKQPAYNWVQWSGPFDCLDTNASINPGASEICGDGKDNNCDGLIDQDCTPSTCSNGVQDGNETGVDCGGFCDVCSAGATPTSCVGLANTCGSSGTQNCCSNTTVFGADFYRTYDGTSTYNSTAFPATINSYRLDWYEVTVGRFRKFVEAYDTWHGGGNPAAGAGAHPLISGSGWDATWPLAADAATLASGLACDPDLATWTDSPGANENRPIGCVTWYEAFAFCNWDNGRLPTDAEWNLAAAGGPQQRAYPWSVPSTDLSLSTAKAAYGCLLDGGTSCTMNDIANVGTIPGGNARYFQSDMGGNVWEWNLDWYESAQVTPCVNCANLAPAVQQFRVVRGGSFQSASGDNLRVGRRSINHPGVRNLNIGFRCARGN